MKSTLGHQSKTVFWISLFIGAYAILVLIGWIFKIDYLTRSHLFPLEINMKFNTALVFLMSSISLYFISEAVRGNHEMSQIILPATTLIMLLIMSTLLISGLLNVSTGLENLFVIDTGSVKTVSPGAESIPTMVSFIVFGLVSILSLFEYKQLPQHIRIVGYFIFIVGVLGMLGYILHIPLLYYKFTDSGTPIAYNSAFLFVLLGIAMISIGSLKHEAHV